MEHLGSFLASAGGCATQVRFACMHVHDMEFKAYTKKTLMGFNYKEIRRNTKKYQKKYKQIQSVDTVDGAFG